MALVITEPNGRKQSIDSLRLLATFLEKHPEMPLPMEISPWHYLSLFPDTLKEFQTIARAFGSFDKGVNGTADELFEISRRVGAIRIKVFANRNEVCQRIVVGVERVPTEVVPEKIVPAHDREIVRWECSPLLADATQ